MVGFQMQATERKSGVGCWVAVAVLGALLVVSAGLNLLLGIGLAARGARGAKGKPADEFPQFTEVWSYGAGEVKAVRIPIVGIIAREFDGGLFAEEYDRVESVLRQIRAAQNDEDVRAILLEVSSPGGELTATDEIYGALKRFKASSPDRKVVVFVSDLAASGGYYVSAAGDWIVAEPTALVGSIGVILQALNIKGLGEKLGVRDTTVKSGEYKDLLNPFRDATAEELAQLQSLIDEFHGRFFQVVLEGRGLSEEALRPVADGRILTSEKALERGLVDQIGYWEDAVKRLRELLHEEAVRIVRYEGPARWLGWLRRVRSPLELLWARDRGGPKLMYLWQP